MKTSIKVLIALALAVLVTACAGPKFEQDYNPGTQFDRGWGRYEWRGGQSQIPGVEHSRLKRVAQEAMAAKGYRLDNDNPQFYVSLNGATRAARGGGKTLGLSIGLPIGGNAGVGLGGSKSLDNTNQEGVIVMDFIDAQTDELVWRGSAAGIDLKQFELSREDQLKNLVAKLLAQYPPE